MYSKPATLEELKLCNARAHARFLVTVVARSEAELLEPRLPSGWSVRDVLGHLGWWDRWLVHTLYPEIAEFAANPPPLLDEITSNKLTLDEINARVFAHNQARSLNDIRREFASAHSASVRGAALLTEADVFDAAGRSARIGWSVAELVFGIYEHYEEHAQEIEAAFG